MIIPANSFKRSVPDRAPIEANRFLAARFDGSKTGLCTVVVVVVFVALVLVCGNAAHPCMCLPGLCRVHQRAVLRTFSG